MRRIAMLLVLSLLAGCTTAPKKTVSPTPAPPTAQLQQKWQQHQQQVSQKTHWQARGRLAVSQGSKGGNASYVWQQMGDAYQIKLFGPFGAGAVYITGRPQQVELKEANGKITRAQSPEMLLKKVAGWDVPLTGLQYWLRGLPTPSASQNGLALNANGQLQNLQEQGWRIAYEEYATDGGVALPNKLQLQNGKLKIKMLVSSWQPLAGG